MAQYNNDCGVCFNDNDGGASRFVHSRAREDFTRHYKSLGKLRARIFFMKIMWRALMGAESMFELENIKRGGKTYRFEV